MGETKPIIGDILGLASASEALKISIERSFDGVSALLTRICLPAAEELGLWFQDHVRHWRLNNIIKILNKAEGKITFEEKQLQIHPRIMHEVIEEGSWCEDSNLQEMWAGILSSSCTDKSDDSNLLFVNALKQVTATQARLINHICIKCKVITPQGLSLIQGSYLSLPVEELMSIAGSTNMAQLDCELDDLRAKELIGCTPMSGGIMLDQVPLYADVTPRPFLLNMYAKTQGFNGDLRLFYKGRIIPESENSYPPLILKDNGHFRL